MSKSTALMIPPVTALTGTRAESKEAKFRRLANGRALQAIAAIERLGQLSAPAYEYSDLDIASLARAIRESLDAAVARLKSRTTPTRRGRNIL